MTAKRFNSLVFLGSMHTLLNQTLKAGIKDTRESTGMVPEEMEVMKNLKMGSLVRMGKFGSSYYPIFMVY